jgi:hypothetical protein
VRDVLTAAGPHPAARLDFIPEEALALQQHLLAFEKPQVKERQRAGQRKGPTTTNRKMGRKSEPESVPPKLGGTDDADTSKAAERVAEPTGYSAETLRKADKVVQAAEAGEARANGTPATGAVAWEDERRGGRKGPQGWKGRDNGQEQGFN